MKKIIIILILIGAVAAIYFIAEKSAYRREEKNTAPLLSTMKIESNSFSPGEKIPSQFTCDGENINPHLAFRDIPEGTKSITLISDDPDAPRGTWVHWTMWNIDPSVQEISQRSIPKGGVEGTTSFGKAGYGGPCPHSGMHRYFFKLYALDTMLDLTADTDKEKLEKAMEGHILDRAEIMGTYERK